MELISFYTESIIPELSEMGDKKEKEKNFLNLTTDMLLMRTETNNLPPHGIEFLSFLFLFFGIRD